MENHKDKVNLLIYKILIHILDNGKKVYLMVLENKLLIKIYIKENLLMAKNGEKEYLNIEMEVIIKGILKIMLFKDKVNILIKIIIGKGIGSMGICKEGVDK
jgi:hypothetical protein